MGKSIRVSNGKETFEINDTDLQSAVNDGFLPTERLIVANSKTKEIFEIDPADLPNALKDGFSFSDTKPEAVNLPPVPKDAYDFNKVLQPVSNTAAVLPQPKTIAGVNDTNEVQDYEATQKEYVTTQKKIAEVDKGDYGFLVPNILIDAERELMDDLNPNRKFAREEKKKQLEQQETIQEQQKIKAVKAMRPRVDAVIQEATSKVDQFVKSSFEGFSIPDPIKIDAFAKEQAKKYGVGEEGYFKTLVYNEVHAAVQSKIVEPLVDKKFHDIYLKANGKPVEDDLAADFNKGFVKGEQIKGTATAQADLVFKTIQTDTKSKADQLHEAALQKTTPITDALKSTEAAIDSQFGSLIKDGKFIGSAEQFQQYQSAIENYKTQAESSQSSLQEINKQFLNELNIINTKNTAQYRRQIKEISIGADAKLKSAAKEYESSYLRDPAIQKKVEAAYKQAYTEVIKGREDAKGIRSNFDPAIINLFKTYTSAFGSSLKNISTTFNFPSGKLLGEYLESEFQVGNTSLKKFVDLFDAQKFAKTTGQLFGGMTPSIIASVGTVAATRGSGASTALQLLASGAAGWAAETVDIVGGMYNDKFAETGDASKAKNAANQSLQSQILLAPTYALEGLPFMGKAIKLGKNALTRALLGGAVEFATEISQEYPQNLFEEAIRKDGTLNTAFNYHSAQKLKETALNIAPVFLLGAYGQAKESLLEKDGKLDTIKASAKAFAQKISFAKFAPGQREQFLFDMMQRQGENFTSAYLLASFTSGQIDKATFNEMSKALTTSADILNKSKDLNLSPAEQKIFTAFTFQYDKAKAAFDNETDPLLKKAAEGIMKGYEAQVTNFASKKQADYSVLTYANNEQYVYTHAEMENALNDYEFSKAVSNGEMKVEVFGNGEQLKTKVQSLLELTPKQKAALDLQAQMKAELEKMDFGGNVEEEIKPADETTNFDNLTEEQQIKELTKKLIEVNYAKAENNLEEFYSDVAKRYFEGDKRIIEVVDEAIAEAKKPIESKVEVLKNVAIKGMSDKMEGRLLNTQQAEELQKEIESNYSTGVKFGGKNNDIRQNLFNYDNPMSEKTINGVNLRIGEGLIRDKKKTYLLYANGKIIGEFYSKNDIYAIVKYIEKNLISDTGKVKKKRKKPSQHKDPIVIAALDIDPVSPDIIVAQHFINGGTIGSIAIQELFGGKKMVGKKKIKGEMTKRISYIRKDGLGIDGLGDKLWDGASEEVQNMYDSQDFSNAVEQYVRDFTHRKQMAEDLVNRYGGNEITEEAKQAANYENYYGPADQAIEDLTPEQFEILTDENNAEGVDFQEEIEQLEADKEALENVDLTAEEKAIANEQINDEIALQIINDNQLSLDNLEQNKDRLFNGFPYEPQDYIVVKKLLSNDRPNNQEPAANEQQGVGDANNQEASVDGKNEGNAGTNAENNRPGKDQVPGDQEIKALEKSVADINSNSELFTINGLNEPPLFSSKQSIDLENPSSQPASVQNLRKAFPDAVVVQNQSDLPQTIQDEAAKQGIAVEGVYFEGKVYMVAENMDDMGRAEAVYRHEKIGHQGVIAHFKNNIASFANSLVDGASKAQLDRVNAIAQKMFGKNADELTIAQKSIIGQEFIAQMAENPTEFPNTWAKVVAWVRETLRSLGIDLSVTDYEIKVLLAKVAQNQQAAFKQTKGEVLFMNVNGEMTKVVTMPDVVNGFYSPLEKVIRNTKFDKLPAKQWLEKFAVGEEAKWTGLSDWLSTQEGSVSKADIQKYLEDNRIQVVEVVNGTKPKLTVSKSSNGLYYAINVVSMEPLWGPFKTEQAANDYIAKQSMPKEQRLEAIRTEFNANTYGYFLTEDMAGDVIVEDKDGEFVEGELPNARLQALAEEYYEVNESSDQSDDTKFSGWQLEGDKGNYKEVLVTMPSKSKPQTLIESLQKEKEQFKSSHFDEPNILVHLRINTRTDVDGNKVLFLEEVQSDWGQKGKKEGFKEPHFNWDSQLGKDAVEVLKEIATIAGFADWKQLATAMTKSSDVLNDFPIPWDKKDLILSWLKSVNQDIKVPSAPFVTDTNAWTKLGLKVALKEAVKQGADKIAWTTGEQQNERYNLKKIFSRIVIDVEEGLYEVHGYDLIGKKSIEYGSIKKENLQEYVGKELAEKAIQDGGGDYRGLNLEVGGKGMKGFYGSPAEGSLGIVGNVAKSLFKQEPKTTKIKTDGRYETPKLVGDEYGNEWKVVFKKNDGESAKFFDTEEAANEYYNSKKSEGNSTQHSIDITPELKAQVEQGLPLFSGKAVNQIAKEAAHFIKEMQAKGKTMAEMVDAATDYMEENWDDKGEPFDRDSWRDLFVAGINKKNAQLKATDGSKPTPAQISIAKAKYAAAIRKDENIKPNIFSRSWKAFSNSSFYIDNPNRYITKLQQSIEKVYDIRTKFVIPLGRMFEQNATGQGYYRVREFLNGVTAGLNKKQLENFKEYLFAMRTKDRLTQSIHNNAFNIEAANRATGNISLTEANILLESLKQKIGAEVFADFEKRGANMQRLMDQMLQRLVESGILSQEAYDEIKMQNDFYAHFNVLQKIARYDDGTGVAVPSNIIKNIKGIKAVDGVYSLEDLNKLQDASNEDLLDANGQIQKNADGTNKKVITKDDFYKASALLLDDLLDRGIITDKQYIEEMAKMGDSGFEISDILDKTANIIFDSYRKAHRNELMKRLGGLAKLDTEGIVMQSVNGFELRYDKDGKASSVPKRLSDIKVPEEFGVIGYRVEGKQKFLAIEFKAANTINGLDKVTLPGWMKGVNFMNVVFRTAVITLSLPFQVSNFIIDTYRSLMFSRYGLLAGKSMTDRIANLVLLVPQYMNAFMVSGAANAGKHTELFKEFMKSGAYSEGQFDDPFTSQKLLKVGKKSFFQHIKFGGLDKVFKLFEGVGRTFEQTQKIVMFERGMDIDAGIRMGVSRWKNIISEAKSPDDMATALDQIAYEIQNFAGSPNFPATHGLMKVIGVIFQFFSARVKGEMSDSRRIAAMFGANTEGVKMSASERMQMLVQFAAMATPIIYMALKNIDDDDDEEEYLTLSPYDRLNNMIFPTGTFDYEDDDGNVTTHREMVKVPLRGITSTINSLAVDFARYAKSKDPALLKHALVQLAGNLSPLNINNTDYLGESILSNLTWIPKAALEITNNRNYFLHEDLIPDRFNMKGVGMTMKKAKEKGIIEPYYVFTKRTPDWAIEWSKGIYESSGISITPVALDYMHRNVFGNIVNKLDLKSVKGRILRSESNTPVWQNR